MPRHRARAHEEEHENHERWLITYADMITLLMAFFVMMYGLSILDLKKFAEFKDGMATQLGRSPAVDGGAGVLLGGTGIAAAAAPPIGTGAREGAGEALEVKGEVTRADLDSLVNEVTARLDRAGLTGKASLEIDPRGLVVHVADRVLFESGSAYLRWEGRRVLDQLAGVLADLDNLLVDAGHPDDRPRRGGGAMATNWELSTARATQVLRWMEEVRGLPSVRMSAAGYADTRPRASNDTPDNRALNRRVEIVIRAAAEADASDSAAPATAAPEAAAADQNAANPGTDAATDHDAAGEEPGAHATEEATHG